MRTELKSLQQRLKATTIHITHDQTEAMTLGDRVCVLHNGVIQRVAPPLEIYEKPANRFVAGFFGILPMNFFDGIVQYKNDCPYFVIDDESILLPVEMKDRLITFKGRNMVLGIGPEHLSLKPNEGQNENSIRCTVAVLEPLGDRMALYLKNGSDNEIIVSAESHVQLTAGKQIKAYVDINKIHIFEKGELGRNLLL